MNQLTELAANLKVHYGDESIDPLVAERALIRALVFLNVDLQQEYEVTGDPKTIKPELKSFHRELLLLRALAYLVRIKRKATPASASFNLITRTSSSWTELERDLLKEYWRQIKRNIEEQPDE
jgi:hypothetical protein